MYSCAFVLSAQNPTRETGKKNGKTGQFPSLGCLVPMRVLKCRSGTEYHPSYLVVCIAGLRCAQRTEFLFHRAKFANQSIKKARSALGFFQRNIGFCVDDSRLEGGRPSHSDGCLGSEIERITRPDTPVPFGTILYSKSESINQE